MSKKTCYNSKGDIDGKVTKLVLSRGAGIFDLEPREPEFELLLFLIIGL